MSYPGFPRYFAKNEKDYVVRFFDCEDSADLRDLRLITESPEALRWMDDNDNLNIDHYQRWMNYKGQGKKFLFAIADPVDANRADNRVHGFVYIYPSEIFKGYLEVSYAKRPDAPAGLTVPAIGLASKFVFDYLQEKRPGEISGIKILAEIEKGNEPSIVVAERAGFKKVRDFDEKNNGLWMKEIRVMSRVRQLNNSFCAPATLQILLSHFGIEADQEKLVTVATTREHVIKKGMSVELLAQTVHNLYPEMSFWVKREASVFDLEKMTRVYNYPVGVNWQGIFEDNEYEDEYTEEEDDSRCKGGEGHYCVVVDVDTVKNYVRMMDPYGHYSNEDRFHEIGEFLNRWWDDRVDTLPDGSKKYVYEKRLMFVIVPKNVTFPEEMGMTPLR